MMKQANANPATDRRDRLERRRRVWWSVCYGSFKPRRRTPTRRQNDSAYQSLDWHSPHLLALAIGILLLSVGDAFCTLALLPGGFYEANPIMSVLLYRSVAAFTAMKMTLTSVSLVLMVFLSRYRFMRVLRVEWVLYCVLATYIVLIGYEFYMLNESGEPLLL